MKPALYVLSRAVAVCGALFCGAAAHAHVVLDQERAPAGSSYRAVFRVGHGCDGLATRAISVRIPTGVLNARPMPKPGWTLTVRTAPLATPYMLYGKRIDADIAEVTWTAQRGYELDDAWYDEFVLRATLPGEAGTLWFPVVQTCDDRGRDVRREWVQVPAAGAPPERLREPAAMLRVDPAPAAPSAPPASAAPAAAGAPGAHVHH